MEPCIASGSCGSLSSTRTTTSSPCRTLSKLRICATISKKDEQQNHCFPIDHGIIIEGKTYPKSIFEHVFREETSQTEIESAFLSDMINMVIGGSDATILAMGAKSIGKDEKLYGDNSNRNGLVQLAISKLMTTLEEKKSCEERVQVRMSAVLISQNNETIVDILSPFNPDPRHRVVKVVDSPRVGVFLENESEIRVESVDQALFYLNTAVDHRLIQEDQTYRTSHVFISFSLYSYKMSETQMEGGRRRLSFLDMGIGERNSTNGGMTMPALGSVLMAMVQKNKHVPFRDTKVCQIIRCALSTSRFTTFIFSFGPKNDDNENIAHLACKIARTRVKNFSAQSRKSIAANSTSDATSSTDTRSKKTVESGSELSAAETVIFLGPSTSPSKSSGLISPISTPSHRPLHRTSRSVDKDLTKELVIETKSQSSPAHSCHSSCVNSIPPMLKGHTPFLSSSLKLYDELCSPTGTPSQVSPNAFGGISLEDRNDFGVMIATPSLPPKSSSKTRYNLDDGKRKQILQWMENSEAPPILFQTPCFDSSSLGGSSNSSGEEVRDCVGGILSHPLEDIIEIEEESLRTSTATTSKDHPLRILSKNNLIEKIDNLASVNQRKETAENKEVEGEDENDLELVMAASLSSMKSHDILAKLETMRSTQSGGVPILTESMTTNGDASEMNVYRRASHLEEYAMMKIKEMEENKLKKKRAKMGLNCCQQSMLSSSSTTMDWNQLEMKIDQEKLNIEEEQRKDALRERRAMLKITELELKKERSLIDKELDDKKTLANSIARQLQHFSLSPCRGNSNSSRLKQRSISSHRIDPPIGSLPSTPTMSQRKITNGSLTNRTHWSSQSTTTHQSLPRQTKTSTSSRKTSIERKISSGKDRKPTVDNSTIISKEKKLSSNGSKEELCWRSPYSHMTSPKTYGGPGTSSSGRGSSAPGSEFEPIGHRRSAVSSANTEREYNKSSVINDGGSKNEKETKSKRQSYSASSGYESANDYHICSKQSIFDKRMNEEKLNFVRQKDTIKQRQYKLKKDLESAKKAIGQAEDDKMVGTKHFDNNKRLNGLNRTTLIDTLLQENRILEKRIVAARNHSMFVTTFI